MPPCGMGLVRISRMRRPPSNFSWNISCASASFIKPVGDEACRCRRRRSRRARRRRAGSSPAARRPGRAPGGRFSSSRNCRFQQISRMSLSNTLRPWRTWSSADCSRSRLYCSASDASSSRRSADWLPASRRRSSSDSTRREDAAPMALASRCSVKRSRWMSASASGEAGALRLAAYSANERSARSAPR